MGGGLEEYRFSKRNEPSEGRPDGRLGCQGHVSDMKNAIAWPMSGTHLQFTSHWRLSMMNDPIT